MKIAQIINELNKAKCQKNLSAHDVAEITGLHTNTIYNLLNKRKGNIDTLYRVSKALGFKLEIKNKWVAE